MGERTAYENGVFCWPELLLTDPDGAKSFYADLLGWDYEDVPLPAGAAYSIAKVGGLSVAGLTPLRDDAAAPAWLSYVKVEDADAASQRATELGGSLEAGPFDVMDQGRRAVLTDRQGAVFALWQPQATVGSQLVNAPGALTWNQLNTSDAEDAERFYSELFGWNAETAEGPDGTRYTTVAVGESPNGGIMAMPAGGPPPSWVPFFVPENLDAAAKAITETGGALHVPPMPVPAGRFLMAADPQGAAFGLFEGELDP